MPDNDAKSQTMMQGFDLKVVKKSACTNKLHKWRTNEKHMFLEMNFEQIKLLMVQIKNDQQKHWKAWSTLSASWKWSSWRTNSIDMLRTIKRTKKRTTTTEELKFWLMNQMQIFNFPRNEKINMRKGASYNEWTSRRQGRPNIFIISLKATKKWTIDDGHDEIVEQNLRFVEIQLKSMTNECCQNFDVDADKENRKLNFYHDKN